MSRITRQSGFTLIEIAVVLVIVGLLVGSFINTFSERIETTRISETDAELADIKDALIAFAFTRGGAPYLPCPDVTAPPDGAEDRDGFGNCSAGVNVGVLPWRTLGFARADAWSTQYSYWVNNDFAVNTGFTLATDNVANYSTIRTRVNDVLTDVSQNAVAVVFSHGKNGLGGISSENVNRPALPAPGNGFDDEIENQDANRIFISRYRTDEGVATAGGAFDDIVVWINAFELKARMIEAGAL
jgi:prepilin-type N-terminal cleavage/methylation domain-containing protein